MLLMVATLLLLNMHVVCRRCGVDEECWAVCWSVHYVVKVLLLFTIY